MTGEIIDTWCYFSGGMGGPDAVTGFAHQTCALWCSARGIPVGLLAEDGTVHVVPKIAEDSNNAGCDTALSLAAHKVTAGGVHYQRNGIDYILVSKVVEDLGSPVSTTKTIAPCPPSRSLSRNNGTSDCSIEPNRLPRLGAGFLGRIRGEIIEPLCRSACDIRGNGSRHAVRVDGRARR